MTEPVDKFWKKSTEDFFELGALDKFMDESQLKFLKGSPGKFLKKKIARISDADCDRFSQIFGEISEESFYLIGESVDDYLKEFSYELFLKEFLRKLMAMEAYRVNFLKKFLEDPLMKQSI